MRKTRERAEWYTVLTRQGNSAGDWGMGPRALELVQEMARDLDGRWPNEAPHRVAHMVELRDDEEIARKAPSATEPA